MTTSNPEEQNPVVIPESLYDMVTQREGLPLDRPNAVAFFSNRSHFSPTVDNYTREKFRTTEVHLLEPNFAVPGLKLLEQLESKNSVVVGLATARLTEQYIEQTFSYLKNFAIPLIIWTLVEQETGKPAQAQAQLFSRINAVLSGRTR